MNVVFVFKDDLMCSYFAGSQRDIFFLDDEENILFHDEEDNTSYEIVLIEKVTKNELCGRTTRSDNEINLAHNCFSVN